MLDMVAATHHHAYDGIDRLYLVGIAAFGKNHFWGQCRIRMMYLLYYSFIRRRARPIAEPPAERADSRSSGELSSSQRYVFQPAQSEAAHALPAGLAESAACHCQRLALGPVCFVATVDSLRSGGIVASPAAAQDSDDMAQKLARNRGKNLSTNAEQGDDNDNHDDDDDG